MAVATGTACARDHQAPLALSATDGIVALTTNDKPMRLVI